MSRRALLVIALVAVLARVSFELALRHDRDAGGAAGTIAAHLLGDERAYDGFARQVAAGSVQRERAFYQEPLYAWTLGQVYRLFPPPAPLGPSEASPAGTGTGTGTGAGASTSANAVVPKGPVHEGVIAVQHLLGVLMAVLVAALGARCFGPAAGWLAGLFAALSGPAIFAESMLLKESAALLLWVLALHLWLDVLQDKGGRRRALLLGALLGLTVLLRGNTYLLLGLVLASLLVRLGGRRRAGAAALVLLSAMLAISPATLHNLRRGDFVLSTYQAGSNAAIGQPDSDDASRGVTYEPIRAGRGDAAFEEQDAVAVAEAGAGRHLTGREVSAWWWRQAGLHVAAHPAAAAARIGLKLLHTFHGDEVPDVKDWAFFKLTLPWLASPLSDLTWLGPLALLGFLVLPWREPRGASGRRGPLRADLLVVRGSVAAIAISLALFYVMGRYRLPAAPGLWILAAGVLVQLGRGVADLVRRPSASRPNGWARLALLVLGAGALIAAGRIPIRRDAVGQQASWANLASIERAQATAATTADDAQVHRDAAVAAAQHALRIAPGFPEARVSLIYALDLHSPVLQRRAAEAWQEAWRLLLVMEGARTGTDVSDRVDGGMPEVQQAVAQLRALPTQPGRELYVSAALAIACRRVAQDLKQPAELSFALDLVDEALRAQPDDGDALVQRGLILQRLGRVAEAEKSYRDALARGIDTIELHNNLGNVLIMAGRGAEAVEQLERAQQLDPGNQTVKENLARARTAAGR